MSKDPSEPQESRPISKYDKTSMFNDFSKKYLELIYSFINFQIPLYFLTSYAILQEYDNQPEKVGPFNQP